MNKLIGTNLKIAFNLNRSKTKIYFLVEIPTSRFEWRNRYLKTDSVCSFSGFWFRNLQDNHPALFRLILSLVM